MLEKLPIFARPKMFSSLRIKLTLWYALILALALIVFALAFYLLIGQTVGQLADDSLQDASDALVTRLHNNAALTDKSIEETLSDFRFQYIVFLVRDGNGKLIATSPRLRKDSRLQFPTFNIATGDIPAEILKSGFRDSNIYSTFTLQSRTSIRIFQESTTIGNRTLFLATLRPLTNQTELLLNVRFFLFSGIPVALLLSILGGYYLARKSLSPLREMNQKASYISSRNLHERLPTGKNRDELEHLAITFNDMLARLEGSFELQKRFMSDASHELRTPLAIIRGEAEVSLQKRKRPEEEYRESLEVIEQEGIRLSKIIEDLFTLARVDADQYNLNLSTFYLDELVSETSKAIRTLLKSKNLQFEVKSKGDLIFEGDETLIRRLLIILLDNAVKHSRENGEVKMVCEADGDNYRVQVFNSGDPIPLEEQDKIFERFYRADASRIHSDNYQFGTGAGIGLAMGRWIAEAHQGKLTLEKSNDTETVFAFVLPITSSQKK